MARISRISGLLTATVAVGAAFFGQNASAQSLQIYPDYSQLAPQPAALKSTFSGMKASLADAIRSAEQEAGRRLPQIAVLAKFLGDEYKVSSVLETGSDIVVDAKTGKVQPRIGLAQAVEAAEGAASGKATAAEFTGRTGYAVVVYTEDERHLLRIDAHTGDVLEKKEIPVPSLPGWLMDGDWITTDSGLMYYDVVVGDGESPSSPSEKVEVHYSGWLTTGTKFDSSHDRGVPATFQANRVILGWQEGLMDMKVGGRRKMLIPGNLAYGPEGRQNPQTKQYIIQPNAMLLFDVQLLHVGEKPPAPVEPAVEDASSEAGSKSE